MSMFTGFSSHRLVSNWVERMRLRKAVTWKDHNAQSVANGWSNDEVSFTEVMLQTLTDASDQAAPKLQSWSSPSDHGDRIEFPFGAEYAGS